MNDGPGPMMVTDHMQRSPLDWGAEVRAHNARVVASIVAMSIPFDQAEELASQAWARLIEQHHAGQLAEVKLPGLAIRQARFLALTWLEGRRRDGGPVDEALVAAPGDPESALIARRDVEIALGVVAASSKSAQAVFYHLYDDPRPSHEEVAERVGISVQRVRQILCEVRKKIREALEAKP
jgi:RNA polymerase sigma-70 factor (ECF subfamily)